MPYVGNTIGSALATGILVNYSPKVVLLICLACNVGALLVFAVTDIYGLLVVSRMATGIFQVFFAIFQPVWADVFGNEVQKSLWLTYLIIATPLGVVIGYGMCAGLMENAGWRWAFYIQAFLLIPSFLGLIFIPGDYFDV